MAKLGLLFDYEYCTGCHACEAACQMEHGFPALEGGLKIAEVGPWKYGDEKWQYSYIPMPTDLCDLCEGRRSLGKSPTCVQHCQSQIIEFGDVEDLSKKLDAKTKQIVYSLE